MDDLNYKRIVIDLDAYHIVYVLTGSVAAALYGVALTPHDFDIAPDLSERNLMRLAAMLVAWGARPIYNPAWKRTLSPEECAAWTPYPPTAEQLDHLLDSPYGLLDVVPTISGAFAEIRQRALPVQTYGVELWVAHPADLIATMSPTAQKHIERMPQVVVAHQRVEAGALPGPLESLTGR